MHNKTLLKILLIQKKVRTFWDPTRNCILLLQTQERTDGNSQKSFGFPAVHSAFYEARIYECPLEHR